VCEAGGKAVQGLGSGVRIRGRVRWELKLDFMRDVVVSVCVDVTVEAKKMNCQGVLRLEWIEMNHCLCTT
jgi:hypothetical protein